jgi:hypothetical protein
MKKIFVTISVFLINTLLIFGQEKAPSYFKNGLNNYELSLASSGTNHLFDLGWNHLHSVSKNKKF